MKKQAPKTHHIGGLVHQLLKSLDQTHATSEEEMLSVWRDVVGGQAAGRSHPSSLMKGVLRVVVDNPGWMQELTIRKRMILKKLQSHFGKDKITDIRYKIS